MLLYKVLGLLLYFWGVAGTSSALKGSTIFHLIMTCLLLSLVYMKLPFYQLKFLKLVVILTAGMLSISFLSLIDAYVENKQVSGSMQILIILLPPLVVKGVLLQFRRLFKRILQGECMNKANYILHFGVLIEDFLISEQNSLKRDETFLPDRETYYGVLSMKGNNSIEFEKLRSKKLTHECESQIYLLIADQIGLAMTQKMKNSKLLALYLAQIYVKKIDNIPKALEIMRRLENTNALSSVNLPMRSSIEYINASLKRAYN
ncbi:MAG: hypothetical protein EOO43_19040, partial [Flavobacterium sp.]